MKKNRQEIPEKRKINKICLGGKAAEGD